MVGLWLSLGLIAAFALAVLAGMSMIKAEVAVSREGGNDEAFIRITVFGGLIKMKLDIPDMLSRGWQYASKFELADPNRGKQPEEKAKQAGMGAGRFGRLRRMMTWADAADFAQWAKASLKRVRCRELSWSTEIGAGDAAETALAAGLVWAAKGTLLGLGLQRFVKLEKLPVLSVKPLYGEMRFSTRFRCIFAIRLGHAIGAGLGLLIRILKAKGGIVSWRSTRFRA